MVARRTLIGVGLGAIAFAGCQNPTIGQFFGPSYEAQLAEHLATTGAKMYGAYWCPHCARQKQIFSHAAGVLPYVECDSRGPNPQVELCNTVGINAYPTWQINGEFYLGAQPLATLAELSGFQLPYGAENSNDGTWGSFSPAQ